jgi:hypothetical protein
MRRWLAFSGLVLFLFGCGATAADAHVIASTGYSTVAQDGSRVNYLLSLEYAVLARAVACEPAVQNLSIGKRAGQPYADLALTFACPGSSGSFHLRYKVFQDADAVVDDHLNQVATCPSRVAR